MTGFHFYPPSDTEQNQLMKLHQLFLLNNNMGSVWCDIIILVLSSAYLHFTEYDQLTCTENVILHSFLHYLPYIIIYNLSTPIMIMDVVNKAVKYFYILILIYVIYPLHSKSHTYNIRGYVTTCYHILIMYHIFLATYLVYILFLILCENCPLTSKMGRCWNTL